MTFNEIMSRKSVRFIILSGIFFSFLLCFAPGFMTTDTYTQFNQAMKGVYDDWHPPVMAFVWRCLLFLQEGPLPLLCFQLLMLFGACYLLSGQKRPNGGTRWVWIFFPLLPQVYCLAGVIWKDVQMAFSLLLGMALYFYWDSERASKLPLFGSVLFLAYAVLIRHNAIFAVLPLIFFVSFWGFSNKKLIKSILVTFFSLILFVVISNFINYGLLNAKITYPQNIFIVNEISFASHEVGQNLFSESSPYGKLNLSDIPNDMFEPKWDYYRPSLNQYHSVIKDDYTRLIMEHPLALLKVKLSLFAQIMKFPLRPVGMIVDFKDPKQNIPPSWLREQLINVNKFINNYAIFGIHILRAFFLPVFFIPMSIILLLLNIPVKSPDNKKIIILVFSTNLYLFSYFFAPVIATFRYLYWDVLGSVACLIIQGYIFADKKCKKHCS